MAPTTLITVALGLATLAAVIVPWLLARREARKDAGSDGADALRAVDYCGLVEVDLRDITAATNERN